MCVTVSVAARVVPFVSAAGVSNAQKGKWTKFAYFFVFWPGHVPAAGEILWRSAGTTQGEKTHEL